jgi:hypothetical protein
VIGPPVIGALQRSVAEVAEARRVDARGRAHYIGAAS